MITRGSNKGNRAKSSNYKEYITADYGNKDLYKFYCTKTDTPVPYSVFIDILKAFNLDVVNLICEGEIVFFPHRLSKIFGREHDRNPTNLMPDWAAMNKLAEESDGKEKVPTVYMTNEYYYRVHWASYNCTIKNSRRYRFKSSKNLRNNFSNALNVNETLKHKLRYNVTN